MLTFAECAISHLNSRLPPCFHSYYELTVNIDRSSNIMEIIEAVRERFGPGTERDQSDSSQLRCKVNSGNSTLNYEEFEFEQKLLYEITAKL